MSEKSISAKMRQDGTVMRVNRDGTEQPLCIAPPAPMTEAEIAAAALSDADALPLTDADLKRMRRVPRVKTLRRALGLIPNEFSARYQVGRKVPSG